MLSFSAAHMSCCHLRFMRKTLAVWGDAHGENDCDGATTTASHHDSRGTIGVRFTCSSFVNGPWRWLRIAAVALLPGQVARLARMRRCGGKLCTRHAVTSAPWHMLFHTSRCLFYTLDFISYGLQRLHLLGSTALRADSCLICHATAMADSRHLFNATLAQILHSPKKICASFCPFTLSFQLALRCGRPLPALTILLYFSSDLPTWRAVRVALYYPILYCAYKLCFATNLFHGCNCHY